MRVESFTLLLLGMDKMETFKPPIGSAIIFPSTAKHRVRPVEPDPVGEVLMVGMVDLI